MLTDLRCRTAKAEAKPYKLADAHGLFLFITPTGFRSWRWKYRFAGKEKQLVLGPYPEISLTEAREKRDEARRLHREGIDPGVERKQRKAAQTAAAMHTFQSVAEEWMRVSKPKWAPRYALQVEARFKGDVFPKIGSVPVDQITPPMVLAILRSIEQRGALELSHKMRQHISKVFGLAIGAGIATNDPAAVIGTALLPSVKKLRPAATKLPAARRVLQLVEAEQANPVTKLASRLLALTAVRPGVLRHAELQEFWDLDGPDARWTIPAAKMKLDVERKADATFDFTVPLSRQAVETVKVAMQLRRGTLLFPGVYRNGKPISDTTLSGLYLAAGLSGKHVPHGWRASFSTIMNELAAEQNRVGDRAIIDMMLAHIQEGVEAVYNRAAYMPRRREIAQEWADMLLEGLPPAASLLGG